MNEIDTIMKLRVVYRELDEQFKIGYNDFLTIKISKRLRSQNGNCSLDTSRCTGEVSNCKITMSKALLDEFGWERFEKTFRHEVAHLANRVRGGNNHDRSFKRICKTFGGSMNSGMAKGEFASCATVDFVKTIKKWQYSCPCGYVRKTAKRMSRKKRINGNRYRCGCCGEFRLDTWQEKKIG